VDWKASLKPWVGVIAGTIVISVIFILKMFKILPIYITGILLLFAGGLGAGLLTRGRADDGALAGATCGIISIAGMVLMTPSIFSLWLPPWKAIEFRILSYGAMFVPLNCLSGIVGIIIRNSSTGEKILPEPGDAARTEWRIQWLGIGIGALILPGFTFLFGSFDLLLVLPGLLAGTIAGLASSGGTRKGYRSGLIAISLGLALLAIPIIWQNYRYPGFATGFGWLLLILMVIFSYPSGFAGGSIGGYLRTLFRRNETES